MELTNDVRRRVRPSSVSRGQTTLTLLATCGCGKFRLTDPASLKPAMDHAVETGHTVQFHGEIRTPKIANYR